MTPDRSFAENFQIKKQKNEGTTITIDGYAATGKGTAAEQLSEILGITNFSASDVFYEIAEHRGLTEEELSEQAEEEVDRLIDRKTVEKAMQKPCIVDSRISSWILGTESDLRIRLKASQKERVRRLKERDKPENPKQRLVRRDRADAERYRNYYGIDMDSMQPYHLVIDNTNLEINSQKELLEKAASKFL